MDRREWLEQERQRALLSEWLVVLAFFAVVALLLVVLVRLPVMP